MNSTTNFTQQQNVTIDVVSFLNYLDYSVRTISLLVHIFYFAFILKVKEFQSRQMIYLHNVNVVGLIYSIQYAAFITNQTASLGSPYWNNIVCMACSMIWMILKYARMYSLLLLALFRYTSVYNIKFHRGFTRSLFQMIMAIVVTWLFSLGMSILLKYAFGTSYSVFYCFEGYSENPGVAEAFLATNIILAIVVPMLLIIFLYVRILQKIKELSKTLNKTDTTRTSCFSKSHTNRIRSVITNGISIIIPTTLTAIKSATSAVSNDFTNAKKFTQNSKNRQTNFATQLILINGLNIAGSILSFFTSVDLNKLLVDYYVIDADFDITKPMMRILFLGIQSVIPILTIFLSPWKKNRST